MASMKQKSLLKQMKSKKTNKQQVLQDADDHLQAGVEDEDAMGKHRAGDGPKSLRFARKALDIYDQGLARFPTNFDLAYNKARLLLEVATHPVLVRNLDVPRLDVLQQALTAHDYAMNLNPDDADTMFNLAQVKVTIAEILAGHGNDQQAIGFLSSGLSNLERCLIIQQIKLFEGQQQRAQLHIDEDDDNGDRDSGGVPLSRNTTTAYEDREEQQEWFNIVVPVTPETLLETIIASISALTTMCSIFNGLTNEARGSMAQYFDKQIHNLDSKADELLTSFPFELSESQEESRNEFLLARSIFAAQQIELRYRTGAIDVHSYTASLTDVFRDVVANDKLNAEFYVAHAKALIAFDNAVRNTQDQLQVLLRWKTLSQATTLLAKGAKASDTNVSTTATTHLLRGDISLLLRALGRSPASYEQAITNRAQLLRNAEVFYRNANKLFDSLGRDDEENRDVGQFREAVVKFIQAESQSCETTSSLVLETWNMKAAVKLSTVCINRSDNWRKEQLDEMIDDGLVP